MTTIRDDSNCEITVHGNGAGQGVTLNATSRGRGGLDVYLHLSRDEAESLAVALVKMLKAGARPLAAEAPVAS